MFIIIVFWLGCDRPSGLLLFVPDLLFSILTPLFLPPSSVSLSYFILAVPMLECLGKHACMSSPFPIAILNGTFFTTATTTFVYIIGKKRNNENAKIEKSSNNGEVQMSYCTKRYSVQHKSKGFKSPALQCCNVIPVMSTITHPMRKCHCITW